MATITEDYVSFETAKLLKEKGFKGLCTAYYDCFTTKNFHDGGGPTDYNSIDPKIRNIISAPTLQMVMKWLREMYNIVCNIDIESRNFYYYSIFIIKSGNEAQYQLTSQKPYFETYKEACEAAIKYCLEHLI